MTGAYVGLVERNLTAILEGRAELSPQDHAAATRARKRTLEDNRIDWSRPTESIRNLIRAVGHPYPGAYCRLGEHTIRIWKAREVPDGAGSEAVAPRATGGTPGAIAEVRPEGAVVRDGRRSASGRARAARGGAAARRGAGAFGAAARFE